MAEEIIVRFADFSTDERFVVRQIVERAIKIAKSHDNHFRGLDLEMDIAATCHHTPLKLHELLKADDANFMHDVFGIMRHIDRRTGLLMDCFVPRFAQ